jgi:DNA end-binding protein Ku
MRKEGMVVLGRVVFTSREHVIAQEPRGKSLLGMTLRYPYEVRKEDEYSRISQTKNSEGHAGADLASSKPNPAHVEPEKFEDQYEGALKELLEKKQASEKIEAPRERAPAKVINLMDALRQSVEAERGARKRRKPERHAAAHQLDWCTLHRRTRSPHRMSREAKPGLRAAITI